MGTDNTYYFIGLMSGTSLDGIDLCYAQYIFDNKKWSFSIIAAKTYAYTTNISSRLATATASSAIEITRLDYELGEYFGNAINGFIDEFNISKSEINAIASHGHTIFHLPDERITLQIGCGTTIALKTGIPTINNFRLKDVRSGGQGAPLVPIGDRFLFNQNNTAYLNIGGFANISLQQDNNHLGFDICPVNIVLNEWSQKLGKPYDDGGQFAQEGKMDTNLVHQLNNLTRYTTKTYHSLGSEWVEEWIKPLFNQQADPRTILATFTEHVAEQIVTVAHDFGVQTLYITGGGAYNTHLIKTIKLKFRGNVEIPDNTVVEFKEALIFGFLGALFLRNEVNCLAEITGAPSNTIGGILHTL